MQTMKMCVASEKTKKMFIYMFMSIQYLTYHD